MSEWLVHIVEVQEINKHPNADTLGITDVYGQSVIVRLGSINKGDIAIFLPPDSILPNDPEALIVKATGLPARHCVDAKRLRGIFSNGIIVPALEVFKDGNIPPFGTHVAEILGITKWESPVDVLSTSGENIKDPGYIPCYTDIEALPRWRSVINDAVYGEVVVCEKIHGANYRFCLRDGQLHVGSRTCWKKNNNNIWWNVANQIGLEDKLKNLGSEVEHLGFYGEVFGQVQDLQYGVSGLTIRIFDIWDSNLKTYLSWDKVQELTAKIGLETVPVLYRGLWNSTLEDLAEGKSTLADHIREGYVVRPTTEQYHPRLGRLILKHVGQGYKLRKKLKTNVVKI